MRGFLPLAVLLSLYIPRTSVVVTEERPSESLAGFPPYLYAARRESYASYDCLPSRIHLAQSNNVLVGVVSMTVSYSLDHEKCAHAQPTVVYGRGDRPEGQVRDEKPLQFNYTSSKSNGMYKSDWIYHTILPDLEAGNEEYWYRIEVQQQQQQQPPTPPKNPHQSKRLRGAQPAIAGTTPHYVFRTPPMPGSPTTLALVGDLGQTANSSQTMFHIWQAATTNASSRLPWNKHNHHPVTNVLIAGDMSYADSDPLRWTSWMELVEPLARGTSLAVAAGNHEIECDTTTNEIFVPYEHWFRNPNRIQDAVRLPVTEEYRKTLWDGSCSAPSAFQGHYDYGNAFYSYQHGLVHVIVLGSYSDATVGSVQYQWLQHELQSVDRQVTPWLLVSFHSPLYTTFQGHVDEIEAVNMKQAMEPLFVEFGVNLVISGHDHGFMKTHSLAYGQVDPTGLSPVYLTLGAGGNREGHSSGYRQEEPEAWVAERNLEEYGYGHLYVPNATHALFQWIRDGSPVQGRSEHEWIYNPHHYHFNDSSARTAMPKE